MKKLLVIATAATIAATSVFAGTYKFGVDASDLRLSGRIEAFGETFHVPGYYEWLVEKKDGVNGASKWQLRKLAHILSHVNDQQKPHFDDTCLHIIMTMEDQMPKQIKGACN